MDTVWQDVRLAVRRLRSAPLFALAAIVTLAAGIGANTAIFSIADGVLFRPLPYVEPDALHIVIWRNPDTGARYSMIEHSYLQTIDEHHSGLSAVALLEPGERLVDVGPAGAEYVQVSAVTPNYFDLLGTRAAHGRLLAASDESATGRAAVLTYSEWQTRFGRRDDIVGRPLTIGTSTFDIVGVLPPDFVFPSYARQAAVITVMLPLSRLPSATGTIYPIVRRLPGVTREQAQAELDALVQPMGQSQSRSANRLHLEDVRSLLYPTGRPIMGLLLSASALVLLLGCANLANMLLARVRYREREIGIRVALGARRRRLVREIVCETLLIGVVGAALALLVTYVSFDLLLPLVPAVAYGRASVGVDARVLAFGVALGLVSALLVAAIPAWRVAGLDAQRLLQRRLGNGRGKIGRPMLAAQVAIAVLLVFGAAVTARALITVLRVPLGFSAENVIRLSASPAGLRGAALQGFYVRVIERLSQRGDVVAVGGIASIPLGGSTADEAVAIGGMRQRGVGLYHVLPGYFEALEISLRRGRLFDANDVQTLADVAVVSERAVPLLFPGRDPVGASLASTRGRSFVVVGVVADVRMSLDSDSTAPVYVLGHESTRGTMSIVARMRARSETALAEVKREVALLAPGTPIGAGWWSDAIASNTTYRNPRFQSVVLGSFAGLALVLTATGILGVVTFLMAGQTREMGIRIAIGATPSSLVVLMLRQTLTPVAVGLLGGLLATRWAGRLAEAQLFNVKTHDPITLAAAALTVLVTAALAAYLPARRAGRVDPISVLRAE